MKRLYSVIALAIMMLVSFTASAQVRSTGRSVAGARQAEGILTRIGDAVPQTRTANFDCVRQPAVAVEDALPTTTMTKAPALAHEDQTWTSLGTGSYTADCLTTFFNVGTITVDVEIWESEQTPGFYRVANPSAAIKEQIGGTILSGADDYMFIHAENPSEVWTETFNTGFQPNSTYGNMVIYSYAGFLNDNGNTPTAAQYGSLSDGCITFPEKTLLINWPNYSGTDLNKNSLYYGNQNGAFKVSLPGAKDYSVAVVAPTCAEGNIIPFTVTPGADVVAMKYLLLEGTFDFSASSYAYVAANGNNLPATGGSFNFTLADANAGRYTLLVATLDANGEFKSGEGTFFYVIEDDAENWKSLGNTRYGEDFVGSMFNVGVTEYEVEIQENVNTPGFYRLVNPYVNHTFGSLSEADGQYHDVTGHNHFMYIHAENPEQVWIEESPVGLDLGYGGIVVCSMASDEDLTDAGTLVDGVITFGEKKLLVAMQNESRGAWYYANNHSGFYVEIPGKVVPKETKTITIDFTAQGWSNNKTITELTVDGIQLTFAKGSGSSAPQYKSSIFSKYLQFNANNTLNITTVDDSYVAIKKIVFTTSNYAINASSTWSTGTYTSSSQTWSGNTTELLLTEGSSAARLTKMVLTIEYKVPPVDATYTITPLVNELQTEMTGFKLSGMDGLAVGTGVITVAKGDEIVAEIDADAIEIEGGEATITLDEPIVGPASVTITVPQGAFTQNLVLVKEKTASVTLYGLAELNLAAATADMERLEALQTALTQAINGNERFISAEDNARIEEILGETYMMQIASAMEQANEDGVAYTSPIDFDALQEEVNAIIARITALADSFQFETTNAFIAADPEWDAEGYMNLGGTYDSQIEVYSDFFVIKNFLGVEDCNLHCGMYYDEDEDLTYVLSPSVNGQGGSAAETLDEMGMGVGTELTVGEQTLNYIGGIINPSETDGYVQLQFAEGYYYAAWGDNATSVELTNAGVSRSIFSVTGHKLNRVQKGLNIVDGKLMIVR